MKSVRPGDEPNRAVLRLAYAVCGVSGFLLLLWLMGYLGFRLGFAPAMRAPDLLVEGAGGFAAGVSMFISLPQTILEAGIAQPLWLMLGFAMIAIPGAILGGIQPTAPGGPKPKPAVVALSIIGGIFAALNAAVVIWWAVSPLRAGYFNELPFAPAQAAMWLSDMQTVGGLDVLALTAAALWVVVVLRLTIPLWMRLLTSSFCVVALAIIVVGAAVSNVTISQITAQRPISFLEDGSIATHLIMGHTPRAMATIRAEPNAVYVHYRAQPMDMVIVGQQSIVEFVSAATPPPQ